MQDRGWTTQQDAAAQLGLTPHYLAELVGRGLLVAETRHGRRFISRESLDGLTHERARWITLVEAGRMLGVSSKTAQGMARRGLIRQRRTAGTKSPSVSLESVLAYLGHHRHEGRDVGSG